MMTDILHRNHRGGRTKRRRKDVSDFAAELHIGRHSRTGYGAFANLPMIPQIP